MPSTSWTAPASFSSGDTLTAAQMNVISDDLKFLKNVDRVRVYQSASQSVADQAWEHITFDSEDYDSGGLHSTSSNTDRLVAQVDGWYQVKGQVTWESNATGRRDIQIRKNDTSSDATAGTRWARVNTTAVGSDETMMQIVADVYLGVNDYVGLYVWQNSTGGLEAKAGSAVTWFSMTWSGD
jgi:hypothetical protein